MSRLVSSCVKVAEGQTFRKELFSWLTVRTLSIISICNSYFSFKGNTLVLIASVPCHCLLFSYSNMLSICSCGNK